MENIISKIINRAKENVKSIVLPEGTDERVLKAARIATDEKIANIILVGNKNDILKKSNEFKVSLEGITLIDPNCSTDYNSFVDYLFELRKNKGITIEECKRLLLDPVYYGVVMVKKGLADGLVSGAIHSTADTLRPALQIIKSREGLKTVSSFFLMEIPNSRYETEYVFSDCGLVENPDQYELSDIAIEASKSYRLLVEKEPKVSMLSYSTYGSASSPMIDKVKEALKIVKEKEPELFIDGELQVDAALDKTVALKKAPGSSVAGEANTLIFPNLEAGNIGYKLVERFGAANAYGPITQGLAKPVNDLSRGSKTEDIVGVIAITCLQSNENYI